MHPAQWRSPDLRARDLLCFLGVETCCLTSVILTQELNRPERFCAKVGVTQSVVPVDIPQTSLFANLGSRIA
jgi:hypothetical protein